MSEENSFRIAAQALEKEAVIATIFCIKKINGRVIRPKNKVVLELAKKAILTIVRALNIKYIACIIEVKYLETIRLSWVFVPTASPTRKLRMCDQSPRRKFLNIVSWIFCRKTAKSKPSKVSKLNRVIKLILKSKVNRGITYGNFELKPRLCIRAMILFRSIFSPVTKESPMKMLAKSNMLTPSKRELIIATE
jgi:hypothetical protein